MEKPFQPNWVSPPADTIKDLLEEKNITIEEFTIFMDLGKTKTNLLLDGKEIISRETADKLSNFLGSTPEFWLKRDGQYWQDMFRLNKITEKEYLQIVGKKLKGVEAFPKLNQQARESLKNFKICEEAYIEDWKQTPKQKLKHKCILIKTSVSDGTFTLNEALKVYNVTSLQYKEFLDKNNLSDNQ